MIRQALTGLTKGPDDAANTIADTGEHTGFAQHGALAQ